MTLLKSCADHVRAFHASLFPGKLKASHAHEIVAAAFGYKSAASARANTELPIEDLLGAEFLLLDVDLIAFRLPQLADLPSPMASPEDLALEIGNFLRFELNAKAHVSLGRPGDLLVYLIEEHLSSRSLARLGPIPVDHTGLLGLPFREQEFGLRGGAMKSASRTIVEIDGGLAMTAEFDIDATRLGQPAWPDGTPSPWYRVEVRLIRHGCHEGYRLGQAVLTNKRGESLDLISNRAAINLSNPFDNPHPGDVERLIRPAAAARRQDRPLPMGTVLELEHSDIYPTRLSDGRPNPGPRRARGREDKEGLPADSLGAGWPEPGDEIHCPYWEKRLARTRVALPRPMSWSDAILHVNEERLRNEPVGLYPPLLYLEGITQVDEKKFILHFGT